MKVKPRAKGILLVIFATMLWGVSGTVAQFLFQQKGFTPEWLVNIRLLVSGIILLFYVHFKSKQDIWKIWSSKHTGLSLIIFSILGMIGVQYTFFVTIQYANAATATILQFLAPVILTCYLIIKSRKAPKLKDSLAIVLAMVGTFFIITKGNIHSLSISKMALIWGIASAFASAVYTVQPRNLLVRFGSTLVVGWGMLMGGIFFSFYHQPWDFVGQWSFTSVLAVIFVVLFGTVVAFCCFLESLKYIKPTEASVLSSVEPLSSAFLSVVWLKVPLSLAEVLGTLCIMATIVVLSSGKSKGSNENQEDVQVARDITNS